MRPRAALASMAFVALVAPACGPPPEPVPPGAVQQVVCQGVPASVCNQAFDTVGSRGPIVQVVVRCSQPVCTELGGEADVLIVFADGRRETSNYGWASAPAMPVPVPVITPPTLTVEPICQGVPLRQCQDLASSIDPAEGLRPIGSITVRCNGVCTAEVGQGQTVVQHLDGTADTVVEWAYGGGGG